MHHIKFKIFWREACGWFMFNRFKIIWVNEVKFWEIISVRINQGALNHAILTKWQVKNRWTSSSSIPHLQQNLLICFEYLPARAPVGIALRRKRHAKVWTLGMMFLFFHTWLRSSTVAAGNWARVGSPKSCNFCKQARWHFWNCTYHLEWVSNRECLVHGRHQ